MAEQSSAEAAGPNVAVSGAVAVSGSDPVGSSHAAALVANGLGIFTDRMGITIIEASPDRVVGVMPVEGNTQPYGLLHGGASCVLAETLGSVGAALHALELHGGSVVGVDINATHHRGVRSGNVTGVATPLQRGASVASYQVVITDDAGERVCTARLTCLVRRPA